MFIKPLSERKVPDPFSGDILPENGREVEINQYWYRRIEDGDVEEITTITTAE